MADQRESLGEEGLKSKRQRLEKATEDNEVNVNKLITKYFRWLGSHHQRYRTRVFPSMGRLETSRGRSAGDLVLILSLSVLDPLRISRQFMLFKGSHFPAGEENAHAEALIIVTLRNHDGDAKEDLD